MATLNIFWRARVDHEQQARAPNDSVQTGVLTDEEEELSAGEPVIVEDVTGRVYTSSELPPGAVVYVEAPPGPLPSLAVAAQEAGFRVVHVGDAPAPRMKP